MKKLYQVVAEYALAEDEKPGGKRRFLIRRLSRGLRYATRQEAEAELAKLLPAVGNVPLRVDELEVGDHVSPDVAGAGGGISIPIQWKETFISADAKYAAAVSALRYYADVTPVTSNPAIIETARVFDRNVARIFALITLPLRAAERGKKL